MSSMYKIHKNTLQDLEFPTVLGHLVLRCHTELGKEQAMSVQPLKNKEEIVDALWKTSEYLSSFSNDNHLPNHGFDSINTELKLLKIDNATLEIVGFRKIGHICTTVTAQLKFLKKFQEYYPLLYRSTETIEPNAEIPSEINEVIDKFGEIRDNASPVLHSIRQNMGSVKGKINQSFAQALGTYQSSDYLDDIRESVVDNRRVLAVKAMYRKKVKGSVMGSSKTGSIVYIEPEATLRYSRELNNLEFEEKEEIQRILKNLTDVIRPYGYLQRKKTIFKGCIPPIIISLEQKKERKNLSPDH